MSDLFRNHIVGFFTRWLNYSFWFQVRSDGRDSGIEEGIRYINICIIIFFLNYFAVL